MDDKKITLVQCECVRGLVSCHHVATVLLHAWNNISVTDKSCSWSVKKKSVQERNILVPIDEVRKRKKKLKITEKKVIEIVDETLEKEATKYRAVSFNLNAEGKRNLRLKIKECGGAAASLSWLLGDEPDPTLAEEEELRNNPGAKYFTIYQPRDIILGKEYEVASNKLNFLTSYLSLSRGNIEDVAEATAGQRKNDLWFSVKEWRFTASNFGDILHCFQKRNGPTPSKSLLMKLYKPRSIDKVKEVQWGILHEDVAVTQFSKEYDLTVKPTGLWLDESGIIGASPDGLISTDAIAEIKCPWKHRNSKLPEALTDPKDFVIYEKGKLKINRSHEYYHQVQGQLYCTKRVKCYFVMYTQQSLLPFLITEDKEWQKKNVPLLKKFYVDYFIPFVRNNEISPVTIRDITNVK